ncbi:hypothetical protein OV207_01870 [Corallococcus sp. BB11-1]|uniref:hypothetical protein n=1 Tax=Corallococcus sp. BB11-1 TaxID=2996783 RepID=UPI00226D6ED6|nr:hypothetical protein [Corallococcus sp. BB11-1]MCY1030186.1 hypothetical protein [Corallococcus sp. BB11-1]
MKTDLDITIDNLTFEIARGLPRAVGKLAKGQLDGAALLKICLDHRRLAIAHLLGALDVRAYSQHLQQSARAYVFMLRQARVGTAVDPYYLCRSRAEPFWDALAAGDFPLAAEIAALVPAQPHPGMEDPVLFLYFDVIMAMARGEDTALLQEKLRALDAEKDPTLSFRYDASSALFHGDDAGLAKALEGMGSEHAAWFAELSETDSIAPEDAQTQTFVFMEGLALARLASHLGMQDVLPQRFIPEVALAVPLASFDDPWRTLEG